MKKGMSVNDQIKSYSRENLDVFPFLFLCAALSWTIWSWPVDKGRFIYATFFGWRVNWPLDNLKIVVGNCLPGILALFWTRFQGRQQFRDLLSTLFA